MTNINEIVAPAQQTTFWLYAGSEVLASVRCDRMASADVVRRKAIQELDANPGVMTPVGTAPFEQRVRLMRAHVTT